MRCPPPAHPKGERARPRAAKPPSGCPRAYPPGRIPKGAHATARGDEVDVDVDVNVDVDVDAGMGC